MNRSTTATDHKKRVRKSRKQDPLWSELLDGIAKDGPHAKRRASHESYLAVNAELCEIAAAILKRPPQLSDIDEDLMLVIVRRIHRRQEGQAQRYDRARTRITRLVKMCEYATQRYKHPPIDFDDMPLARRVTINWVDKDRPDVPLPPEDAIPEGFDKSMLELPLDKLLDQYVRERLVGKSADSVRLMRAAIQSFGNHLGRIALLGDLRRNIVLDYIAAKLDFGLAADTVQSYRERLVSLWMFAFRKRWLPDAPDIPKIKGPEREPEAWTASELEALLNAAKAAEGKFGGIPSRLFFSALIYFIYDTGERIGAVRRIRYDDMKKDDSGNTWVTIRGELRKGRTRDKAFKLRPVTVEAIAEIKAYKEKNFVTKDRTMPFATDNSETYIYSAFGRIVEAAGLPNNRRTKFHKIRRTVASDFEAAGGNATELLDHDSRRTTKRSYLDPKVIRSIQPADIVAGIGEIQAAAAAAEATPEETELLAKLRSLLAEGGAK